MAPAPRRAFPRAFPHLAGTANSHLSSWPSLPFAPANRPGKQRTPTTSPLTARRARARRPTSLSLVSLAYCARALSSPALGFPATNPAVASRAAAGTRPPSAARAFCVMASRRATSRVRLTPRGSLPVCFPTRTCQELTSEQDPRIQGAKTNHLETLSATDQPTPRHKLRHTLEAPFVNLAGKPTAPSSPSVRD